MKRHNQVIENVKTYIVNTKTALQYCYIAAYYPDFVCWKQQYTDFVRAEHKFS